MFEVLRIVKGEPPGSLVPVRNGGFTEMNILPTRGSQRRHRESLERLELRGHFHLCDRVQMDLIRAVAEAQSPHRCVEGRKGKILRHTGGTVDLDRPVDDVHRHAWSGDLNLRDR